MFEFDPPSSCSQKFPTWPCLDCNAPKPMERFAKRWGTFPLFAISPDCHKNSYKFWPGNGGDTPRSIRTVPLYLGFTSYILSTGDSLLDGYLISPIKVPHQSDLEEQSFDFCGVYRALCDALSSARTLSAPETETPGSGSTWNAKKKESAKHSFLTSKSNGPQCT